MAKKEPDLTDMQREFASQYVIDWNATKAARRTGSNGPAAAQVGWGWLKKPQVQREIRRLRNIKRRKEANVRERLIRELSSVAFSDMRNLGSWGAGEHEATETGEMRNMAYFTPHDSDVISDTAAATISELAIDDKGRIKLKMFPKMQACVELAKLLDLYGRAGGEHEKEGEHTCTLENDLDE